MALSLLHLNCAALQRGAAFEVRPGVPARITQTADERFQLHVGSHTLRVGGTCTSEFAMEALVSDFNFDGWRDVAVPTDTGYGGVNTFYTLYFYRPGDRTFQKSRFSAAPNDLSIRANLVPDPMTRTVDASYKSGPGEVAATLCLTSDGLDLYTCRVGQLGTAALAGLPDDNDWTWYDPLGRLVVRRPLQRSGDQRSFWSVSAAHVPLLLSPNRSSRVQRSLRPGEQLEVLELSGTWAHVVWTDLSKRRFGGWVLRSALR